MMTPVQRPGWTSQEIALYSASYRVHITIGFREVRMKMTRLRKDASYLMFKRWPLNLNGEMKSMCGKCKFWKQRTERYVIRSKNLKRMRLTWRSWKSISEFSRMIRGNSKTTTRMFRERLTNMRIG